jgi:flagellar biosynthesis/type III secretory pathway M-ring protein FliF/YscJ
MPVASAVTALLAAAEEEFDPNDVTPGVEGFVITFIVMAVVLLLVLDMVRRIRRVNYRAEAQQRLDSEQREAEASTAAESGTDGAGGDAASDTPPVKPE